MVRVRTTVLDAGRPPVGAPTRGRDTEPNGARVMVVEVRVTVFTAGRGCLETAGAGTVMARAGRTDTVPR